MHKYSLLEQFVKVALNSTGFLKLITKYSFVVFEAPLPSGTLLHCSATLPKNSQAVKHVISHLKLTGFNCLKLVQH